MKKSSFLISAIFAVCQPVYAGSISCQSDPRDVYVNLNWDKDQANLLVTSPLGYEALPQLEGPVSAGMQSFLKMQAEDLQGLGDQFRIQWSRNRCALTDDDPWTLSCGPGTLVGNSDIQAIGINGSVETERRATGKSERWKIRLTFARGNTYFLTIPLAKSFCTKAI